MKKIRNWIKKIRNWIKKIRNIIRNWIKKIRNWIKKIRNIIINWIEKHLLLLSFLIPVSLIGIRLLLLFFLPNTHNDLRHWIGLDFYQIILISGALIGLLWTNKRYKQGEKNLEQSEEIAFKNKMNTQYLEVIKAISDEDKKKTPIAANLINAIQASIATFYDTEEKQKKAREETLNFRGANLTRADLTGANLTGADLTWADLTGADLTGAYLTWAYLTWAYLKGANLTGADLTWANLTWANLKGANLTGADLTEAHLTIYSLNTLGLDLLDSAINVAKIRIYINSEKKFYFLKEFVDFLKEFVEMNSLNRIIDHGEQLNKNMFDYFDKLSKKN